MCLTVFVNCLTKQCTIFVGVVVVFLLNVMEMLAMLARPRMVFQRIYVLCM